MNQTSSYPDDPEYVNPLYGPGTVSGWYLNLIATMMTWLFHPVRARKDSVDADLVICLTLPIFAVGHLIKLAKRVQNTLSLTREGSIGNTTMPETEAPQTIVATGAIFLIIMLIKAGRNCCTKRLILSAIVGTICATALPLGHRASLPDPELVISMVLLGSNYCIGSLCVCAMTRTRFGMALMKDTETVVACALNGPLAGLLCNVPADMRAYAGALNARLARLLLNVPLDAQECAAGAAAPILFTALIFPDLFADSRKYFRNTRSKWTDLDQVAAAVGGATVLVFDLYSIVQSWRSLLQQRRRQGLEGNSETPNVIALSTIRTHYTVDPDPEQDAQADSASTRLNVGEQPLLTFE